MFKFIVPVLWTSVANCLQKIWNPFSDLYVRQELNFTPFENEIALGTDFY